jgi:hypothetical protein
MHIYELVDREVVLPAVRQAYSRYPETLFLDAGALRNPVFRLLGIHNWSPIGPQQYFFSLYRGALATLVKRTQQVEP